jgi:hypothetical protein
MSNWIRLGACIVVALVAASATAMHVLQGKSLWLFAIALAPALAAPLLRQKRRISQNVSREICGVAGALVGLGIQYNARFIDASAYHASAYSFEVILIAIVLWVWNWIGRLSARTIEPETEEERALP